MAYSTPAMVRKALVPTSDGTVSSTQSHTAADLSDQQLLDAIAEADALIDGYLTRFYVTPVATVGSPAVTPHPVDYWSRNLAAYNATLAFRGSQDFSDSDPVARRYTATIEALKAVSSGSVGLALPAQTGDYAGAGAGPPINPYIGDLFRADEFVSPSTAPPWWSPFW